MNALMKTMLIQFVLLLAISCSDAARTAKGEETGKPERPNILFIMSDDHAYQAISAYGSELINTPNIDRLAEQGLMFTNACVTNSICAPSRATILTGKHTHKAICLLN